MKVSVVGGGNAGVLTILYLSLYVKNVELELIYNPEIPSEPVGQGTLLTPPALLWSSLGFNWYNNPIHATFKSGILYEGWGKLNDEVFHDFATNSMSMHYCPGEMQKYALESGLFKVIEGDVDPKDVDADYIFDCRGKPKDYSNYNIIEHPTNACIIGKPNWDLSKQYWSRHVATPDGWTFVIPSFKDFSGTVGYCYNSNITSKEEAEKNMLEMFDVDIKNHINYKNYVVKDPVIDKRIFLNGNKLSFLEPLESTAVQTYIDVVGYFIDELSKDFNCRRYSDKVITYIRKVKNFILWHYQFGSKYDTPFWDYAKSFTFKDDDFDYILNFSKNLSRKEYTGIVNIIGGKYTYSQWQPYAFKLWYDGMTKKGK
tara:strand:- start:71 stop:1183 length:1113 start_codon:yes stop_codon:yes gene_type:complete